MSGTEIESHLREFVASNFGFRGGSASMDGNLDMLEHGVLDSTGVLEVVAFLESDIGVKVEDDEMVPENLSTLNRIIAFVERKQRASG
jgi:acyl carrier protein